MSENDKLVRQMIRNKTRGTVLCQTCELAESSWQKTKGLMFRKEIAQGHGMLMRFSVTSNPGIWMMGMRFPIDIIFLDAHGEVVRVVENAQPLRPSWKTWKIYNPPVPSEYVLELPAGVVKDSGTLVGDVVEL